jgi:hypothetical protein
MPAIDGCVVCVPRTRGTVCNEHFKDFGIASTDDFFPDPFDIRKQSGRHRWKLNHVKERAELRFVKGRNGIHYYFVSKKQIANVVDDEGIDALKGWNEEFIDKGNVFRMLTFDEKIQKVFLTEIGENMSPQNVLKGHRA